MLEIKLMTDKVPYHALALGLYHCQLLRTQATPQPHWTVLTRWKRLDVEEQSVLFGCEVSKLGESITSGLC